MHFLRFLLALIFCGLAAMAPAQKDSTEKDPTGLVKWMSLAEAEAAVAKQAKPVIVDVYTDWCGWCKHMMRTTFSEPAIANYINTNFYPVRLNAESKDTMVFLGEKYVNASSGSRPPHELAIKLLQGKLSYPTLLFMSNNFQYKLIVPGFQSATDLEPFLVYMVEYVFNTSSIEAFQTAYKRFQHPDSTYLDQSELKWISMKDYLNQPSGTDKKALVFISTPWCNSGRAFREGILCDSAVVRQISTYFTPVYFDAESKDTLIFNNAPFNNAGTYGPIHSLAVHLCNNRLILPSMVFLNSKGEVISSVPQFRTLSDMHWILDYFGRDKYLEMGWDDYIKEVSKTLEKKPE